MHRKQHAIGDRDVATAAAVCADHGWRRREWLMLSAGAGVGLAWGLAPGAARAHHGWSSFDQARPIYLEGRAASVRWRNPHVELVLERSPIDRVPADLPQRRTPAQQAAVDGADLLRRAVLPTRRDARWEVELAPLSRMQAWGVPEITPGTALALVGFTFAQEKGDAVVRVEYLFLGDRVYGLRSSPA